MAGVSGNTQPRVRIKGRRASVLRFFFISISYTIVWITITSELGYYSKLYGPEVLLQLNIAYYLPSIPILILSGHVEKLLDESLGTTASMFFRLLFGLLGCSFICIFFPFLPQRLTCLLWTVVLLGSFSAIAFSTSYQVVAWFRAADTIALGLGCVGSGPLALILQVAFQMGTSFSTWQWIALFECAGAVTLAGLLAAISLFTQYWKILSGEEAYIENLPLLAKESETDDTETQGLLLTPRVMTLVDPFQGFPWDSSAGLLSTDLAKSLYEGRTLRRAASAESDLSFADWRKRALGNKLYGSKRSTSLQVGHLQKLVGEAPALNQVLRPASDAGSCASHSQPPSRPSSRLDVVSRPEVLSNSAPCGGWPEVLAGDTDDEQMQENKYVTTVECPEPVTSTSDWEIGGRPEEDLKRLERPAPGLLCAVQEVRCSSPLSSPFAVKAISEQETVAEVEGEEQGLLRMNWEVLVASWPAVLSALIASTLLNMLFPFFTYVPSSGLVGDLLPQTLFYARIFADMAGRLAPRNKGLLTSSGMVLLAVAAVDTALSVLFFAYLKAPKRFIHDAISVGMVVVFWMLGGYVNTCSYILGPSLVPSHLATKASALLALTHQVAHFTGLGLAAVLASVLFGGITGDL